MEEQLEVLQNKIEKNQESVAGYKKQLDAKKKEDVNSKAHKQPIQAKMDEILYKYGIDRSGAFGGAIDGNGCSRLMGNAAPIIGELMEFVLASQSR
eukprot:10411055-Ditylum_brightwellii.AAC.1